MRGTPVEEDLPPDPDTEAPSEEENKEEDKEEDESVVPEDDNDTP